VQQRWPAVVKNPLASSSGKPTAVRDWPISRDGRRVAQHSEEPARSGPHTRAIDVDLLALMS
jgi:hypothetical protein